MQQIILNEFEKIASNDINEAQQALYNCLQDQVLYTAMGSPSQGVIGSSFLCTYVGALSASLAVGAGFKYISGNAWPLPKFSMIYSASTIPVTFTAASGVHDRIDLVCLAPNFAVTSTASRYVKTGGTGPVVLTTVNKVQQDGYTLQVVAGTPASSPVAPALPAGYIPIAQAYIHQTTGLGGSGDITDERTILNLAGAVSNSGHVIATGTTAQAQLDELDYALANFYITKTLYIASATYTPTAGTVFVEVECVGGGGGSGGVPGPNPCASGGGGGGEYVKKGFPIATIGASQAMTIGAAGTAGNNTGSSGGAGGTTTFGSLLTAAGGGGGAGVGGISTNAQTIAAGGAGGSGNTGNVEIPGRDGGPGITMFYNGASPNIYGGIRGEGGGSGFGPSASGTLGAAGGSGNLPSGGGAPGVINGGTASAGNVGAAGGIVVTEYIFVG